MKHLATPKYVAFNYAIANFAPTVRVINPDTEGDPFITIPEAEILKDIKPSQRNKSTGDLLGPKAISNRRNIVNTSQDLGQRSLNDRLVKTALADKKARARNALLQGERPRDSAIESLNNLINPDNQDQIKQLREQAARASRGDLGALVGLRSSADSFDQLTTDTQKLAARTGSKALNNRAEMFDRINQRLGLLDDGIPADEVGDRAPALLPRKVFTPAASIPAPTPKRLAVEPLMESVTTPDYSAPAQVAQTITRGRKPGPRIGDLVPRGLKTVGQAVGNSASDAIDAGKGLLGQSPEIAQALGADKRNLLIGGGLLGTGAAVLAGNSIAANAQQREAARQQQLEAVRNIGVY